MCITHIFSLIYLLVYCKLLIFAVNSKNEYYERKINQAAGNSVCNEPFDGLGFVFLVWASITRTGNRKRCLFNRLSING